MTDTTVHNEEDDRELVQAVADLRRGGTPECLDVAEVLERIRGQGPYIMCWYRHDVRNALANAKCAQRARPR